MYTILAGDCLDQLKTLEDESVDSIVTDPPYGLTNLTGEKFQTALAKWVGGDREYVPSGNGFMGRSWDGFVPPPAVWDECLRVLKPGGHMAVFAGARTQDLMGLSIRLAGFEIRDTIGWIYGSGFPKSMDVSKAIDKGRDDYPAIREVVMFIREAVAASTVKRSRLDEALGGSAVMAHFLAPSRSNAGCPKWDQWQTLKSILNFGDDMDAEVWRLNGRKGTPGEAWEKREVVGVKKAGIATPGDRDRYTVGGSRAVEVDITAPATPEAARWDGWGTALKPAIEPIILARKPLDGTVAQNVLEHGVGGLNIDACRVATDEDRSRPPGRNGGEATWDLSARTEPSKSHAAGRFPANVLLDEHAAKEMDRQSGNVNGVVGMKKVSGEHNFNVGEHTPQAFPKSSERIKDSGGASRFFPVFKYQAKAPKKERPVIEREDGTKVQHPTVKPVALMEWLVTLITPAGGITLDPFAGSGATLEAARNAGINSIGIEREPDYILLIEERLSGGEHLF